nr:hypothetical protein [Pseudomonadota bacterium]
MLRLVCACLAFFLVTVPAWAGPEKPVTSEITGITLPDGAVSLPSNRTQATLLRLINKEQDRRCSALESYIWKAADGNPADPDLPFHEIIDRLRGKGFEVRKVDSKLVAGDETVLLGDRHGISLTLLWKAMDEEILLVLCAGRKADEKAPPVKKAEVPEEKDGKEKTEAPPAKVDEKKEEPEKTVMADAAPPAPEADNTPSAEQAGDNVTLSLDTAPPETPEAAPPAAEEPAPEKKEEAVAVEEKKEEKPAKAEPEPAPAEKKGKQTSPKKSRVVVKDPVPAKEKPPTIVRLPTVGQASALTEDGSELVSKSPQSDIPPAVPVTPVAQAPLTPPAKLVQTKSQPDGGKAEPPLVVIGDASKLPGSPVMSAEMARRWMKDGTLTPEEKNVAAPAARSRGGAVIPANTAPVVHGTAVPARVVAGQWAGTFDCGQGPLGLSMNLSVFASGELQAIVSVFPLAGNDRMAEGEYAMSGRFDPETYQVSLSPQVWVRKAEGQRMLPFTGEFDPGADRLEFIVSEASTCLPLRLTRNLNLRPSAPPRMQEAEAPRVPAVAAAEKAIPVQPPKPPVLV